MRLQLNRVAHPVTVLGPGRRLGLWVQGCHIGCPGCASVDTWDAAAGGTIDTETLAPELASIILENNLTGLTLTGGEPTEQAEALADLVTRIRGFVGGSADVCQLDVLMFTGLSAKAAERRACALWDVVDAAICGPYRRDKPSTSPLVATSNQQLVILTALGATRAGGLDPTSSASLQANITDGELTLIGLPNPGDLPRLEAALRARGVALEGVSWQQP